MSGSNYYTHFHLIPLRLRRICTVIVERIWWNQNVYFLLFTLDIVAREKDIRIIFFLMLICSIIILVKPICFQSNHSIIVSRETKNMFSHLIHEFSPTEKDKTRYEMKNSKHIRYG